MTRLAGPPRDWGTLVRMRASVKAVATSPSVSTWVRRGVQRGAEGCRGVQRGALAALRKPCLHQEGDVPSNLVPYPTL